LAYLVSLPLLKKSLSESRVKDEFDDWLDSNQFGPNHLHHPVHPNGTAATKAIVKKGLFLPAYSMLFPSYSSLRTASAFPAAI
jgi:hypothetical protein